MIIDRSKRPSSSDEVNFSSPKIQEFILKNGLKVFFSEKKELPIIRIIILVNSGSRFDPNDKKGLSNLLTMCIDEGAGEFDTLKLADEFEMLGAQFSVSCNDDVIIISLQVLNENLIPSLKLVSDVITNPHFNEEDFNREKNKVVVRLKQSKSEPDYVADIAFDYCLFGKDSQYGFPVTGIEKTIQNIQPDSIRNVYSNNFTPNNSTMVLVGNIEQDRLIKDLESAFEEWDKVSTIDYPRFHPKENKKKIFLINKPDAVQTEIRMGHLSSKRSDVDYFQKQIINLILGGQFSSRLNLNLREKNGYTYGVHSRFNYFKEAGYFAVSTSTDITNTKNALQEIYKELIEIKSGLTNNELNFAKSSITKKYPSNFETYRQVAANISTKIIHDLPDDYFETYIDKVNLISLDDVNRIAESSIHTEQLISVLVGESKKILNQLNENDFGEITALEFDDLFKN